MPCPIVWNPMTPPSSPARAILEAMTSRLEERALRLNETVLCKNIFSQNFMPYAKKNWTYGQYCNCADLSAAFQLTWIWVKRLRSGLIPPLASVMNATPFTIESAVVTKPNFRLFKPAGENGNIRDAHGALTGKCYFANHVVCKIGAVYFDPTFDRWTTNVDDLEEREVTIAWRSGERSVLVSRDSRFLYTRRPGNCGPFADSWNEITWAEATACRGQLARLPEAERIPPDTWKEIFAKVAAPAPAAHVR